MPPMRSDAAGADAPMRQHVRYFTGSLLRWLCCIATAYSGSILANYLVL